MSSPYDRAKGGKLIFKGGVGPERTIDKKKKKKKNKKSNKEDAAELMENVDQKTKPQDDTNATVYTIDATTRKNYEQLFPVEAKKFGYNDSNPKSAEDALDERVKKKADRYCK